MYDSGHVSSYILVGYRVLDGLVNVHCVGCYPFPYRKDVHCKGISFFTMPYNDSSICAAYCDALNVAHIELGFAILYGSLAERLCCRYIKSVIM